MTSLQPRGYIAEWLRFFSSGSGKIKGVPSGSGVFLRVLVAELGPPNLPKVSPMANGYTHTEFYYTARQIWTKNVWKHAILKADVLSHQTSSPLPPILPQNPILGDLSMQNLLYRELSVSRTLMDHTKLKLYIYIGIGKYLGCVKIFPIEGVRGCRAP